MNLEANLPGRAVVNIGSASPINGRDTTNYNVYRDNYTPHGMVICATLALLGGPSCPATRAGGIRIACSRVRALFRQHAPGSSKKCVPMTGQQQCELIPGGCSIPYVPDADTSSRETDAALRKAIAASDVLAAIK